MNKDRDEAMLEAMADLQDVCGDLFGLPAPAEIAAREKAFADRALRKDPAESPVAEVIPFPGVPGRG